MHGHTGACSVLGPAYHRDLNRVPVLSKLRWPTIGGESPTKKNATSMVGLQERPLKGHHLGSNLKGRIVTTTKQGVKEGPRGEDE